MGLAILIEKLVPAAQYSGAFENNSRREYEDLVWEDQRPKPTWQDLQSVVVSEPLDVRLTALFAAQSPAVRGQLYALKAGVTDALRAGDLEGARAVIEQASADQDIKDLFLAEFDA